jgi:DNA-binding GntR family transcriptional regulator
VSRDQDQQALDDADDALRFRRLAEQQAVVDACEMAVRKARAELRQEQRRHKEQLAKLGCMMRVELRRKRPARKGK